MNRKRSCYHISRYAIILLLSLLFFTDMFSQLKKDVKLTLHQKEVSPISIFKCIEDQCDYHFIYDEHSINSNLQKVSVDYVGNDLNTVLNELKKQTQLRFRVYDKYIAVTIKEKRVTISGFVTDSVTGENLIGAVVFMEECTGGTTTNSHGYYSLSLPVGSVCIKSRFLGYDSQQKSIVIDKDISLNFKLLSHKNMLQEVLVSTTALKDTINENVDGVNTIRVGDIANLPLTFSEPDIVKSTYYLPGVSRLNYGSCGYSVRGASSGENLVLFDNFPLYNISHQAADLSIFNPDIIQDMSLYKGAISAKYGGTSSSLLKITSRNGDKYHFHLKGGISTVSTRLSVEGPIFKGKLSYLVSLRRSNLAWKQLFDKTIRRWNFCDITAKLHYKMNDKNQFTGSMYYGSDNKRFIFRDLSNPYRQQKWITLGSSLTWTKNFNPKWEVNTSLFCSFYNYDLNIEDRPYFNIVGVIVDAGFTHEYKVHINQNNILEFGRKNVVRGFYTKDDLTLNDSLSEDNWEDSHVVLESGLFVNHQIKIRKRLGVNYGIRGTLYFGGEAWDPVMVGTENQNNDGSWINLEAEFEPRIALSYHFDDSNIKLSYNRKIQNLHQVSYIGYNNTTYFIWVPATSYNAPLKSNQLSLGYYRNTRASEYSWSVEAYYRHSVNNLCYFSDTTISANTMVTLSTEMISAEGKSFGLELYGKMTKENFNGSISYSLSKALRRADEVNMGDWYNSNYDRPHNLALNVNYKISSKFRLNLSWLYSTGMPSSIDNKDGDQDYQSFDKDKINNYRLADYHRLDLGLVYENKTSQHRFHSTWSINVYNVYNRDNTYINEGISQYSDSYYNNLGVYNDYGIMPAISYNFRF